MAGAALAYGDAVLSAFELAFVEFGQRRRLPLGQGWNRRFEAANYLKPFYLRAYLCDPPMTAGGPLSWSRLAAATGRDLFELQDVLERTPPPPPDVLLCEYCGRPPRPNVESGPAPWWCSARCRRRDDLLKTAPSSNGILPDQKQVLPCPGCGAQFIRPAVSPRGACSPRCHGRNVRAQQAELALYENPDAIEDDGTEPGEPTGSAPTIQQLPGELSSSAPRTRSG